MSAIRLGKSVVGLVVALLAIAGIATSSLAAWTARTDGAAGVVADRLGTPGAVAVAAVDQQSLRISWTSPAGPAPTGYVVRRVGSPAATVCTAAVAVGDRLECTDSGLAAGMTYSYTVQAVLHAWQGSESAPASGTTGSAPDPEAGPGLVSLAMRDSDANGKVDRVIAVFDEQLQSSSDTTAWTLANVPSAGTLASVSVSGNTATLTLAEGGGPADTAVGSFTVALAAGATGIRDQAGNPASFAAATPADEARPVLLSLADQPGASKGVTAGKPEAGDTLDFTFSEPVVVPTTPFTVTLDQQNLATTSMVGNPLVSNMGLGATYFKDSGRRRADFTGSTLTRPSGGTIRLTLGTLTRGDTMNVLPNGGTASGTVSLGIEDAAGNSATGDLGRLGATVRF